MSVYAGIIIGIAIGIPIGTYIYRKALLAYLHGEFERINRMLEEEKNE